MAELMQIDGVEVDVSPAPGVDVPVSRGPGGASAYSGAVTAGFTGTLAEWLDSLKGDEGKSAFQLAQDNGFVGTQAQWLMSLRGEQGVIGLTAFQVAQREGFTGTETEWLTSLEGGIGDAGPSAFEVAQSNGFTGTEAEWLTALEGDPGANGVGVPTGGMTGQVVAKASDADFDTAWVAQSGGTGAVDSVNGKTGVVVLDADDIADAGTANRFTTEAEAAKLAEIEAEADVTDAANVAAAGAFMAANVIDEDNMASDSSTKVPTQQSVKAYVDANAGGGGGSPSRGSVVYTTASIADLTSETGMVTLGKSFQLMQLTADKACRVTLYATTAYRTADASRDVATDPPSNSGVWVDITLPADTPYAITPAVFGANLETTVTTDIPLRITNLSAATNAVAVVFKFLTVEA